MPASIAARESLADDNPGVEFLPTIVEQCLGSATALNMFSVSYPGPLLAVPFALNKSAYVFHLAFWLADFACWLVLSRGKHPNWAMGLVCTSVLVGASAFYAIALSPNGNTANRVGFSLLALIACGMLAATAIHGLYDIFIGPDPRRFSFASNAAMDTCLILANTMAARIMAWALGRVTGCQLWLLRASMTD